MAFDFTEDITLENNRAAVIPLKAEHLLHLIPPASADPNLVQYSPYAIHTQTYLEEFIQSSLSDREKGLRYAFAIFDKRANVFAGSTSLANVSNKDLRLEIGWTWLGPTFHQSGLNRACKALLLSYAFDTLGFERIELKTDARNTVSRRAIEKLGAQYEGALRSHTVLLDGYRRTTVYYSILKEEWPALRATVFRTEFQ